MTEAELKHRLAAILAADAAGYSRLMGMDERATLATLDKARAVFAKHVNANRGVVIDTAGDSVLAVFELATGAVSAALAIQDELGAAAQAMPEDHRMRFRIGVHIGELTEKADGTVYGDGVNIAARLQAKASPGAICISQTVYDTVVAKVPMQARFLGPEALKNIAKPMPVWLVWPQGAAAPEVGAPAKAQSPSRRRHWIAATVAGMLVVASGIGWYASRPEPSAPRSEAQARKAAPDGKSIAVLPFTNMSEDKDTAYFADGVHEELLTHLALLGELKVVSRTSVMEYRNAKKNMRQIGTELGVGTLIEGSVRRAGNQVRVSVQLIDALSDKHLWAKSYDRELKDIFAIQSELATEIARTLKVTLAPPAQARLNRKPTENLEAYDLYLRAQELRNRSQGTVRIASTLKDSVALLRKAVELDPGFAHAWARLAEEHSLAFSFGVDGTPARQAQARAALDRALALAPGDPLVTIAEGQFHDKALSDFGGAARAFEKVLATAPHNVDALNGLASAYSSQDRVAESVSLLERALAVEPRNFRTLNSLRWTYLRYRYYDRALAYQQRLIELRPDDLELQARREYIEYFRTGTWTRFDAWRARLPADAQRKHAAVLQLDTNRAIARRNYVEVLRLAEIDPEDARDGWDASQKAIVRIGLQVFAYRAMGDHANATIFALEALRVLGDEVKARPKDLYSWSYKSWMHAVLGERERAFAMHKRAVAVAKEDGWVVSEELARRNALALYSLLGDRNKALLELARQVKLPFAHVHEYRVAVELAGLWDDRDFQAILNDPANSAPIPFPSK